MRRLSSRSICSCEREGIIPALEPAHALARAVELEEEVVLVNMCGRGDKDLQSVLEAEKHDG